MALLLRSEVSDAPSAPLPPSLPPVPSRAPGSSECSSANSRSSFWCAFWMACCRSRRRFCRSTLSSNIWKTTYSVLYWHPYPCLGRGLSHVRERICWYWTKERPQFWGWTLHFTGLQQLGIIKKFIPTWERAVKYITVPLPLCLALSCCLPLWRPEQTSLEHAGLSVSPPGSLGTSAAAPVPGGVAYEGHSALPAEPRPVSAIVDRRWTRSQQRKYREWAVGWLQALFNKSTL